MQTRTVHAAWLLLLLAASNVLAAVEPDRGAQYLAAADAEFAAREAGKAVSSYQLFLKSYPDHPRADHALYMLGQACQLAGSQELAPAYYFTILSPDGNWRHYRGLAQYLARTYGMYAYVSEGDSYWYYDMRAYRELLKRYPKSQYADDCEFLLVEPGPRDWAIGMGPEVAKTARSVIGKYEAILRKYPNTNRRNDIQKAIGELREIERRNSPTQSR